MIRALVSSSVEGRETKRLLQSWAIDYLESPFPREDTTGQLSGIRIM